MAPQASAHAVQAPLARPAGRAVELPRELLERLAQHSGARPDSGAGLPADAHALCPPWIRLAPPIMPATPRESSLPGVGLCCSMERDMRLVWWHGWGGQDCDTLRAAMVKAIHGPLAPQQHEAALAILERSAHAALGCGLAPRELPALVEHNPPLATAFLVRLAGTPLLPQFLERLTSATALSVQAMEVMNRMISGGHVSADATQQYLSRCMSQCGNIQDRFMQNRMVRLVCAFVAALVRSGAVDAAALRIEVQAFCIEFSRVKETQALFQLAGEAAAASRADEPHRRTQQPLS
ncbi:unnamed protein product [Pedinophyceae sp. YPF-701]|nr:unnamed protein product [Pedinophyceae sp. YPF-701]